MRARKIVVALVALAAVTAGTSLSASADDREASAKTCKGEEATIVGKAGKDRNLKGTNGRDVIVARGGDDLISAKGGDDVICAGSGDDFVVGGSGDDRAGGESGSDTMLGGGGTDKLAGEDGGDSLDGGDGPRDECSGGSGDDFASRQGCERITGAQGV